MVTLYSPDTISSLRAASDSLNLGTELPTSPTKPKRWMRSHYIELLKKNENPKDLPLSTDILSWFKSLPVCERSQCISHEAPLISTFIWQMFIKKLSEGEHDFALNELPLKSFDPDLVDRNFRLTKRGSEAEHPIVGHRGVPGHPHLGLRPLRRPRQAHRLHAEYFQHQELRHALLRGLGQRFGLLALGLPCLVQSYRLQLAGGLGLCQFREGRLDALLGTHRGGPPTA